MQGLIPETTVLKNIRDETRDFSEISEIFSNFRNFRDLLKDFFSGS